MSLGLHLRTDGRCQAPLSRKSGPIGVSKLSENDPKPEPLEETIEKLKEEHEELIFKLSEIKRLSNFDLTETISQLNEIEPVVMHHATQEEGEIAEILKRSSLTAGISNDHKWIIKFFEQTLDGLKNSSIEEAGPDVRRFVERLIIHFNDEEDRLFPVLLRAAGGRKE